MTCEPIRSAHYMGTVGAYSSGICILCTSEVLQSCTVEILVLGTQSNLTIGKSKTFIFSSDFLCLLFSSNMPLHVVSQLKVTLIIFWSSPASKEVHAGSWNRRNQGIYNIFLAETNQWRSWYANPGSAMQMRRSREAPQISNRNIGRDWRQEGWGGGRSG